MNNSYLEHMLEQCEADLEQAKKLKHRFGILNKIFAWGIFAYTMLFALAFLAFKDSTYFLFSAGGLSGLILHAFYTRKNDWDDLIESAQNNVDMCNKMLDKTWY